MITLLKSALCWIC